MPGDRQFLSEPVVCGAGCKRLFMVESCRCQFPDGKAVFHLEPPQPCRSGTGAIAALLRIEDRGCTFGRLPIKFGWKVTRKSEGCAPEVNSAVAMVLACLRKITPLSSVPPQKEPSAYPRRLPHPSAACPHGFTTQPTDGTRNRLLHAALVRAF